MSKRIGIAGRLALAALLCGAAGNLPAFAEDAVSKDALSKDVAKDAAGTDQKPERPRVKTSRPTSSNATVNLVHLLVQQGVITQDQADALIKQAEDEAYVAQQASRAAMTKADEAAKNAAAGNAVAPGTKRVTYVPEVVKRELREEIKKEVMTQAKDENWASPNIFPEWATRIRFYGDIRTRYEADLFPSGNDTSGTQLINFNGINTGSPFDITGSNGFPPVRNVDQDRNRFRLRVRLGMEADLGGGFSTGLRIATGDDSQPVSTNQTLGGGGGNFSKYSLWLDRGWLRYQPWENFAVSLGRFDNPFYAPTDLTWYSDLAFDGVAVQAKHEVLPGVTPFVVAGAFPLYDTAINFPSNGTAAQNPTAPGSDIKSQDRYLFGVQTGFSWKFDENTTVKFGAGFFDFSNVQGQLSDPCFASTTNAVCSTDLRRPTFAQYGNTYMALRNIIAQTTSTGALSPQYEYYGLAAPFRVVELTGRVDFSHFNPIHVMVDGTFIDNTAFNWSYMESVAVNNRGPSPNPSAGTVGTFNGGNIGAMARVTVGYPQLKQLWDWNAYVAYKYLESDATVDAFTDPDFGLGGTNLKGYILGFNLGLGQNVWTSVKWLSANAIAGSPLAVDVLQVDLNGRF